MNRGFFCVSAAVLAIVSTAACSPVRTYNGFNAAEGATGATAIADPQVGVDTRDTIQQRFGSPSTTAVFDTTAWYYVGAVQERVAFYRPRTTARQVMVVRFNGDTVSAVEKFGVERGRVIAYDQNVTPTRGRELGLLEQLLGNVGNRPPIRTDDEDNTGSPRRN